MDRYVLKKLLEDAERRMAEGARRVARQEKLIVEMSRLGVDVGPYRAMLATFQDTLHLHAQYVQLMRRLCGVSSDERPLAGNLRSVMTTKITPEKTDALQAS
jgi:hypothetical protein